MRPPAPAPEPLSLADSLLFSPSGFLMQMVVFALVNQLERGTCERGTATNAAMRWAARRGRLREATMHVMERNEEEERGWEVAWVWRPSHTPAPGAGAEGEGDGGWMERWQEDRPWLLQLY